MGQLSYSIQSILGGHSPTVYFKKEGQFLSSLGIDPDVSLPSSLNRAGGAIAPVAYSKFSGSNVTGAPKFIITNPKDTLVYAYMEDGKFVSYTGAFGSETLIGTPTSGAGNGGAYYNNYIYLMTPTNVSRYGPLNSSPAIVNTYWTAATTAGLALTALVNTTYPSVQSVMYANHPAHVHAADNTLYFGDFDSTSTTAGTRGKGMIHRIRTKYGTAGAITNDGAADDGGAYNVLDLPSGYMPMDIESYGNDLAIVAMQTSDPTINQGPACMFLWNTFDDSFYAQIPLPDPLVSAILNVNGSLIVFSGNSNNGFRISRYIGGHSFEELDFFEEGYSPFCGAVDSYGSRLLLGSSTTEPATAATVFSIGYKNAKLPKDARHSIMRSTAAGTSPIVSAMKSVQHASGIVPRVVVGWKDGSGTGIDNKSGTTYNSVFRSEVFTVNKPFTIKSIRIPLSEAVSATTTIGVKIYYDRASTSKTLTTINSTNYTGSERIIKYESEEIEQASTAGYLAQHDFFLEFTPTGADGNQILLPIDIVVDTYDD